MRLTQFNPETGLYEYGKKAKTLDEYRAQRKAVIQRLGEFEDKASDLAEEIFAEIERGECKLSDFVSKSYLAELKKKYTEDTE